MSEFKGTKMEWEARGNFVYNINKTHEIASIITYNNNQEESEANAKLISCAPEMLEMLNKINDFIDKNRYKNYMVELLRREVLGIEQLIKKATS